MKKIKKMLDFIYNLPYNNTCAAKKRKHETGCGSAWLERLIWDQEVAGSNPVTPTFKNGLWWV